MRPKLVPHMARFGAQSRLAGALFDFLSGIDPSAVGLMQALASFFPRRGK